MQDLDVQLQIQRRSQDNTIEIPEYTDDNYASPLIKTVTGPKDTGNKMKLTIEQQEAQVGSDFKASVCSQMTNTAAIDQLDHLIDEMHHR